MTESQKEKFALYAKEKKTSVSDVIRQFVELVDVLDVLRQLQKVADEKNKTLHELLMRLVIALSKKKGE